MAKRKSKEARLEGRLAAVRVVAGFKMDRAIHGMDWKLGYRVRPVEFCPEPGRDMKAAELLTWAKGLEQGDGWEGKVFLTCQLPTRKGIKAAKGPDERKCQFFTNLRHNPSKNLKES